MSVSGDEEKGQGASERELCNLCVRPLGVVESREQRMEKLRGGD